MALSIEQLNKIKSNYNSGNKVEKIARISLGGFLAKYAGKTAVFDEFTNSDQVQFTFFWTQANQNDLMRFMSANPKIDKKIAKAFFDNLFKYNNKGEQLIYATRRTPLPEIVTFDKSSKYVLVVDLLHAEGTDRETGQPFSKYYTKIRNVLPEKGSSNEFLTFSEDDIKEIESISEHNEDVQKLDSKDLKDNQE